MNDFSGGGYTGRGDTMKNDRQMLGSILKTAQMGQISIRGALHASLQPGLKTALREQLREYGMIESEAHAIASQRGWELKELQPGRRLATGMMNRMKLSRDSSDSRIADRMIQENTRGMIAGLKDLHRYEQQDYRVSSLSQRLLDCEAATIRQLQAFL